MAFLFAPLLQFRVDSHKTMVYDHVTRIPLMVGGGAVRSAGVIPAIGSQADLAPTFIELAGAGNPAAAANVSKATSTMDGRSFAKLLDVLPATTATAATTLSWKDTVLFEYQSIRDSDSIRACSGKHGAEKQATCEAAMIDAYGYRAAPKNCTATLYPGHSCPGHSLEKGEHNATTIEECTAQCCAVPTCMAFEFHPAIPDHGEGKGKTPAGCNLKSTLNSYNTNEPSKTCGTFPGVVGPTPPQPGPPSPGPGPPGPGPPGTNVHFHDGPNNTFIALRIINSTASPPVDMMYSEFANVDDPHAWLFPSDSINFFELYDLTSGDWMMRDNIYDTADAGLKQRLHEHLHATIECKGRDSCGGFLTNGASVVNGK